MDLTFVKLAFAAVFVFLASFAVVTDVRSLSIPNWIPLVLVGLFGIYVVLFLTIGQGVWHVAIAGAAFVLGFGFYLLNWFGAGDVKLMAAVMLWAGPENAVFFAVLMAVFGSALSLALIALRRYLAYFPEPRIGKTLLHHPLKWIEQGVCPYGTAIGAAALCTMPAIFTI